MRFDRRAQAALFRCNIITNPALSLLLLFASWLWGYGSAGYWCALLALEAAIVFTEGYLLSYQLGSERKWTLLSLIANGTSFMLGLLLSLFIQ